MRCGPRQLFYQYCTMDPYKVPDGQALFGHLAGGEVGVTEVKYYNVPTPLGWRRENSQLALSYCVGLQDNLTLPATSPATLPLEPP